MNTHPNTSAAVLTGALATCIVWVYGEPWSVNGDMPPEVGTAFGTLLIALVLFIGRRRGPAA